MHTFAPAIRKNALRFDSLAQQVEHNTFNVGVLGSSPKRITKKGVINNLVTPFFIILDINSFTIYHFKCYK